MQLKPLQLLQRGNVESLRADTIIAKLPQHIGQRELAVIASGLGLAQADLGISRWDSAYGPGNAVTVVVQSNFITEAFTGFGMRGVTAERVAEGVVRKVRRYLAAEVPVGPYLADQLLLPIALAGSGSYLTLRPSAHTTTNIDVIKQFIDCRITQEKVATDSWCMTVG